MSVLRHCCFSVPCTQASRCRVFYRALQFSKYFMYMLISTFASGFSLISNLNGNFPNHYELAPNLHFLSIICGPNSWPWKYSSCGHVLGSLTLFGGYMWSMDISVTLIRRSYRLLGCKTKLIGHFVAVGFLPSNSREPF